MYDWKTFTFGTGQHKTRKQGMCVMEAVAYIAGEKHSDHPKCACPILSTFLRFWNDAIKDDDRRRELLGQFVFRLPGTKASPEIEVRRSFMCLDWLVRVHTPAFLDLCPALSEHAESLRNLAEITDMTSAVAAGKQVAAVRDAAWGAVRGAVRDAAWDAAKDAALDAASAAAKDAALAAVRDAAVRGAVRDAASAAVSAAASAAVRGAALAAVRGAASAAVSAAASAAVRGAALAAVRGAAWDALKEVTHTVQDSAVDLVDRMIRLTEIQEIVPVARARRTVGAPPA